MKNAGGVSSIIATEINQNEKRLFQKVILLFFKPLPNPPLKQIRGGYKSL